MKMLDCPTSVVHRLGDDDVDDEPMVDHETIESRYGVSDVAQARTVAWPKLLRTNDYA